VLRAYEVDLFGNVKVERESSSSHVGVKGDEVCLRP